METWAGTRIFKTCTPIDVLIWRFSDVDNSFIVNSYRWHGAQIPKKPKCKILKNKNELIINILFARVLVFKSFFCGKYWTLSLINSTLCPRKNSRQSQQVTVTKTQQIFFDFRWHNLPFVIQWVNILMDNLIVHRLIQWETICSLVLDISLRFNYKYPLRSPLVTVTKVLCLFLYFQWYNLKIPICRTREVKWYYLFKARWSWYEYKLDSSISLHTHKFVIS